MASELVRPLETVLAYYPLPLEEVRSRAQAAREALGSSAVILAHHYQSDDIVAFADYRGDSLELSRIAGRAKAKFIIFCGVDFMAESAAILCSPEQTVVIPAAEAPCPMAAMVDLDSLRYTWDYLEGIWGVDGIVPLVYQNSNAVVKAFCGEHGGAVCTSSNAQSAITWGLRQEKRILFAPDRYLATNSALALGYSQRQVGLWNRNEDILEAEVSPENLVLVAWDGYCSVHRRFTVDDVAGIRAEYPGVQVIVHPECTPEVVQASDASGSTSYIVKAVENADPGSKFAIGTEVHLVDRLAQENPDKTIVPLKRSACVSMSRTDLYNLCYALENLAAGNPVNVVTVPPTVAAHARAALARMLEIQ